MKLSNSSYCGARCYQVFYNWIAFASTLKDFGNGVSEGVSAPKNRIIPVFSE